jgi:hypothetical protein
MNLSRIESRNVPVENCDSPYLFAFGVSPDKSVYDRRLPCLRVGKAGTDGVNFDVLRVIDIDELLVDVGAVRARVTQVRVGFAGFVPNLAQSAEVRVAQWDHTLRKSLRPPPPRK